MPYVTMHGQQTYLSFSTPWVKHTYSLHGAESSWEANLFAASQEIPRISRNPKVHYRTHKQRQISLSWASPIQSIYPHPISCRSIIILSTHLRLGLPSGLFPSGFPTKTLCTPLSSPIRATCPAHLILLHFITRTILGEQYKSFSSSLFNHIHSPVTSSHLGPNILLNTMFSNTLSFLSSRNVNDQVSHPYKSIGKITGTIPRGFLSFIAPFFHLFLSLPPLNVQVFYNYVCSFFYVL